MNVDAPSLEELGALPAARLLLRGGCDRNPRRQAFQHLDPEREPDGRLARVFSGTKLVPWGLVVSRLRAQASCFTCQYVSGWSGGWRDDQSRERHQRADALERTPPCSKCTDVAGRNLPARSTSPAAGLSAASICWRALSRIWSAASFGTTIGAQAARARR